MRLVWFSTGFFLGLVTLSLSMGAIPETPVQSEIIDNKELYRQLREIEAVKQREFSFDSDILSLSVREKQFRKSVKKSTGARRAEVDQ